jgi:hypothetical protein
MKVIDFEASQPMKESEIQKLQRTLEIFHFVRDEVHTIGEAFLLTRENQDELANRVMADRFMVEDVVLALLHQTAPIFSEFMEQGFWTLGREAPRFGTPWSTLSFYDIGEQVELLVRCGGSFVDDEDPPKWVSCPMISTKNMSYGELSAVAAKSKAMDIWWRLGKSSVEGKLVFR